MPERDQRLAIVGLGTVGRWLLDSLASRPERIEAAAGQPIRVVAVASRSEGFVHAPEGIAPAEVLGRLEAGEALREMADAEHFETALEGLGAMELDLLAEVSQSPRDGGEPGLSHIRAALERGAGVATSNKWPVALAGVALRELARDRGTELRAESTVMSGTPVISTLTEGIGGARPRALRGVLNATVNDICSRLAAGESYAAALAAAQAAGLAEPDSSEDLDGLDAEAKVMVLSALVFGEQLGLGDVDRHGISELAADGGAEEPRDGTVLRELVELRPDEGVARVSVQPVPADSAFGTLEGPTNAVLAEVDPIGTIEVRGPGAGPALAGQGVLSDLAALARERR